MKYKKLEFSELEALAQEGDAQAQYFLSHRYLDAEGTALDENKAFIWMKKSAEQGHCDAQYYLALMIATDKGQAQNLRDEDLPHWQAD